MTQTPDTVRIPERNEAKFLFARGFEGKPVPRNPHMLDFEFQVTDALFEARRDFSLNRPVPVLSFIEASRHVDKLIHDHRQGVRL